MSMVWSQFSWSESFCLLKTCLPGTGNDMCHYGCYCGLGHTVSADRRKQYTNYVAGFTQAFIINTRFYIFFFLAPSSPKRYWFDLLYTWSVLDKSAYQQKLFSRALGKLSLGLNRWQGKLLMNIVVNFW